MDKKIDDKLMMRTAMLNGIANGVSLVVGMIMIPIISRLLTTEEMGISSTFISTRNIFVFVVTCCAYSYMHKAMLEFKEEKESYIFSLLLFCTAAVAVSFVVLVPFKEYLKSLLSMDDFLFYWLFASSLIMAVYSVGNFYCIFHNKYVIVSTIVLCTGPVAQLLCILLAYMMPQRRYIGRVLGLDFTYFVVAICVVVWMCMCRNKKFRLYYIRHTLHFTLPIVPYQLSQTVLTQCDLIMISYFSGEHYAGIYSMGHTLGFLAYTVMAQVVGAWSPWVYRRLEEQDYQSIYAKADIMLLLGGYMTIGLMTVGTELVKIFLVKDYLPCIYIIPPLVMATFFQFLNLFLYDLEYYYKKSKWIAAASVTGAVLNIILNVIFIPRVGYLAACYTTVVSYFVLMLLNYLFCRKLGIEKIYNMKVAFGLILLVTAYMLVTFALMNHALWRYVLLVLITAVLFLAERKNLPELIKTMKG